MRLAPPFWLLNQREQAKENRSVNERKPPTQAKEKAGLGRAWLAARGWRCDRGGHVIGSRIFDSCGCVLRCWITATIATCRTSATVLLFSVDRSCCNAFSLHAPAQPAQSALEFTRTSGGCLVERGRASVLFPCVQTVVGLSQIAFICMLTAEAVRRCGWRLQKCWFRRSITTIGFPGARPRSF